MRIQSFGDDEGDRILDKLELWGRPKRIELQQSVQEVARQRKTYGERRVEGISVIWMEGSWPGGAKDMRRLDFWPEDIGTQRRRQWWDGEAIYFSLLHTKQVKEITTCCFCLYVYMSGQCCSRTLCFQFCLQLWSLSSHTMSFPLWTKCFLCCAEFILQKPVSFTFYPASACREKKESKHI